MRGASGISQSSTRWQQAIVVRCALRCLMVMLGSSGCMLDTTPLHEERPPVTSMNTSAERDGAQSPPAARDAAVGIVTGQVCDGDASSCGGQCRQDSDCPTPSACHTAVCVEGACQEEAAPDASRCDEDAGGAETCPAGQCGECAAGARECLGQKLRSCGSDGRWTQPSPCEHGCSANACNECKPDSTQCTANNQLQRCSSSGRWGASEPCMNGCMNGQCKLCMEGAKRCTADAQETCSADGTWVATPCNLGCVGDHCAACKAGARECTGSNMNEARTCGDDGEWGPAMVCSSMCMDGQCTECMPGAQRCAGPGVQVCGVDRRWLTTEACPNGCDGMRCAACREGALECPTRTTVRVCRDHMWSDTDNCRPNAHCSADAPTGNTCPCDSGFVDPHPNPGLCMAPSGG